MPINIQDYLLGRIPVGRKIDIPAYLMAKAASGSIQEVTGTLPLYVRSRASQILKNYIIYGTASGAGVETKNLFDVNKVEVFEHTNLSNTNQWVRYQGEAKVYRYPCESNTTYSVSVFAETKIFRISMVESDNVPASEIDSSVSAIDIVKQTNTQPVTFTTRQSAKYLLIQVGLDITVDISDSLVIVKESTLPDHYIPPGYELPLKVTADGTTTDYPIYIGDSKLGEEEYVNYAEQKIYKLVDGTLTPTDPPAPLPDITLPQGIATIDTEEELKPQATIKGKIKQI